MAGKFIPIMINIDCLALAKVIYDLNAIDEHFMSQINMVINNNNCLYVGNSEGWVNLKIEEYA